MKFRNYIDGLSDEDLAYLFLGIAGVDESDSNFIEKLEKVKEIINADVEVGSGDEVSFILKGEKHEL